MARKTWRCGRTGETVPLIAIQFDFPVVAVDSTLRVAGNMLTMRVKTMKSRLWVVTIAIAALVASQTAARGQNFGPPGQPGYPPGYGPPGNGAPGYAQPAAMMQ